MKNLATVTDHAGTAIPGFGGAIWLGKFWTRLRIPERNRQIRFFYVLSKQLKLQTRRLVHVGMRSGGQDMCGFSGQRIIYIVAPASKL